MDPTYIGQSVPTPIKMPNRGNRLSGRTVLIVAGLLVAVLVGAGLMVANRDNTGPLSQRLTLRLGALEDILKDGKKNASSDKLKKITSEASLLLAGDMTAISGAVPKSKAKPSKTVAASEDSAASIARLKDAKINATYNSAYESELTTKLEASSALIHELYNETRNKSLKEALNTTNKHLGQVQKDLAAE